MLAFFSGPDLDPRELAQRSARSLGLFADHPPPYEIVSDGFCAQLPPVGEPGTGRPCARTPGTWQASRSPAGCIVLFHGWFDNAAPIAAELGLPADDPARLYAGAVERWGLAAETRIIGHYCAIMKDADSGRVRLARSPLAAPPLHYFQTPDAIGAASVPRVLVAMGLEPRLNRRKLADALFFNLTEDEGFYEGAFRVGIGQVVTLEPGRAPRRVSTFDPLAIRPLRRADPRDYLPEADRLLTEAVAAATAGARQPGVSLSGGLDSSNVAARMLRVLPEGQRLKSFTFTPLAQWQPTQEHKYFGDESAHVRAFAAMHPRIEPHFTDAGGRDFDTDLEKYYLAMGTGQPNFAVAFRFMELMKLAREQGCDLMVASDMGNATFSNEAPWAFAEYLRHGRFRQLWRALENLPYRTPVPMGVRVLSKAVMPMLPDRLWRALRRWRGRPPAILNDVMGLLHPDAMARYDVEARARAAHVVYERDWYGYRAQRVADNFGRGDAEMYDYIQAAEQVHRVRWRDATAYRPLVEFCLSLPTDAYMRDGQERWLARELGRGLIPETQRMERREGFQNADWHLRMTPRLAEFRAELERARELPELEGIVDFDRALRLLEEWPDAPTLEPDVVNRFSHAMTRVIAMTRYVRFMTGRNQ